MKANVNNSVRTGWSTRLTRWSLAALVLLAASGLVVTFAPFHAAVEWTVLLHTVLGVLALVPLVWYSVAHWRDYKALRPLRRAAAGLRRGGGAAGLPAVGRRGHLAGAVRRPHVAAVAQHPPLLDLRHAADRAAARHPGLPAASRKKATRAVRPSGGGARARLDAAGGAGRSPAWPRSTAARPTSTSSPRTTTTSTARTGPSPPAWRRPRPAAPSTPRRWPAPRPAAPPAATSRSSRSGSPAPTATRRWTRCSRRSRASWPSRTAPESTRYCGGCHDPISLFSGTKNIFVEDLTGLARLPGGHLLPGLPRDPRDRPAGQRQLRHDPARRLPLAVAARRARRKFASDFLIRTYPDEHIELSASACSRRPSTAPPATSSSSTRRSTRSAGCSCRTSTTTGRPATGTTRATRRKTVECRECHMPLVDSTDPAARRRRRLQPHARRRQAPQPPLHRRQPA